ncbi:MAG: AAA-like domain-containing protein [Microcoleaceae cyanobacterium]
MQYHLMNQTYSDIKEDNKEPNIEDLIKLVDSLMASQKGYSLNPIQKIILRESLSRSQKTYADIAQEYNYSESYIKQSLAPKLWQELSFLLKEKVTKYNCHIILKQKFYPLSKLQIDRRNNPIKNIKLELPESQVPLDSVFYIERYPKNNLATRHQSIEQICVQSILQPRALIRIKAPRKMGKTSLLARILAQGYSHNYYPVRLSLLRAGTGIFTSTEKFLRWLCSNVGQQLKLESKLDEYWDKDMGALASTSIYFQGYLLEKVSAPIILALDNVNRLFEYPELAVDVFSLLRSWYEEMKDDGVWQKLRLVISHSTEVYIPFPTNQSPFNVGLPIELPPFTPSNVEDLARLYGFDLTAFELKHIMQWTGGFPYLVRLAFDRSVRNNIPLLEILQQATTDTGIFSQYLHSLLWTLQQNQSLAAEFQQLLQGATQLSIEQQFKLKSMGLIKVQDNQPIVSCRLYQQYFRDKFIRGEIATE